VGRAGLGQKGRKVMTNSAKKNGRPDKLNLLPAFLDALVTTPDR
jgi:hypothetical protein